MSDNSTNNKRIAKNTIMLYFRMIVMMAIGIFTSRVILQALGVDDYGINSVIAGFISMFGIITNSMSSAISRFITVELGTGNFGKLKQVFSMSVSVQVIMGLIVLVLIETFGVWFVDNEMQIPEGREIAAQWCLHCAAITTLITLINVPFNAAIVAHEKMSAFAYLSLLESFLKLAICYAIYVSPFDKLITYSCLGVVVSLIIRCVYWIYCKRQFEECKEYTSFDRIVFMEMWGFAGWNFLGNSSWLLSTQGINMLMNMFFGVVVNAARGVANQVNGVVQLFVNSFMMALNPQITKSYACGDKEYSFKLACMGAKFSFFIVLFIALPIMTESNFILTVWLRTPPDYAAEFVVWTILSTFFVLIGNTLVTLINAHGDIRSYQIYITLLASLPFPLSWIVFKMGGSPSQSYMIYNAIYWILIFVRFYLVNKKTGIPAQDYLGGVVLKCHIVGLLSATPSIAIVFFFNESTTRFFVSLIVSWTISALVIILLGLNKEEKHIAVRELKKIKNRIKL